MRYFSMPVPLGCVLREARERRTSDRLERALLRGVEPETAPEQGADELREDLPVEEELLVRGPVTPR
jgi:hypothetical protein